MARGYENRKTGISKDLERLLMLELLHKGMSVREIGDHVGLERSVVTRDLHKLKKQFEEKQETQFTVKFNENLFRVECCIKDLFRDLDDIEDIDGRVKVFNCILPYIQELNKMVNAYQHSKTKEDEFKGPFLVINTAQPIQQLAEQSPYVEVITGQSQKILPDPPAGEQDDGV